jgi:hypothetical protein
MDARITPEVQRFIEANFKNTEEAFALIDLIDAEFRSDPTSTQCFDARIVDRVKWCAARRREYVKKSPFVA